MGLSTVLEHRINKGSSWGHTTETLKYQANNQDSYPGGEVQP